MLVYIRETDKDKIICQVNEKDIAEHLRVSISAYGFAYFQKDIYSFCFLDITGLIKVYDTN